jgi:hypothetical protein
MIKDFTNEVIEHNEINVEEINNNIKEINYVNEINNNIKNWFDNNYIESKNNNNIIQIKEIYKLFKKSEFMSVN